MKNIKLVYIPGNIPSLLAGFLLCFIIVGARMPQRLGNTQEGRVQALTRLKRTFEERRPPGRTVEFPTSPTDPHYYLYQPLIENSEELIITPLEKRSSRNNCYRYSIMHPGGRLRYSHVFCYPSLVVAGYPKCGTSALYQYIKMCRNSFGGALKESCPINQKKTSLLTYFDALPTLNNYGQLVMPTTLNKQVGKVDNSPPPFVDDVILVGGCISKESNLLMARLLQPHTTYLFLTRNYADWLWSAYNFWCSPTYDKNCTRGNWVQPDKHVRSPEAFHDIVIHDKVHEEKIEHLANQTGPSPIFMMPRPACAAAEHFYQDLSEEYLKPLTTIAKNSKVVILASEHLNQATNEFSKEMKDFTGLIMDPGTLKEFNSHKYNTQVSDKSKGERSRTDLSLFQPGSYQVSGYKPMLKETRSFLDSCWYNDCKWLSNVTGYSYQCSRNS